MARIARNIRSGEAFTLTGRGGNLFIIDDPLKPADAVSEVTRERVIEWFRSTLVTRPDDKQIARIMVVM